MKITMYELLGLVKDGKAPKKIIYRDNLFEYKASFEDYRPDDVMKYHGNHLFHYLFEEEVMFLNDEVEILEEEKKIPEKLEDRARFQYSQIPSWFRGKELIDTINENFEKHQKAIYELIDCLKSKGDE